jgi:hypothetical protein
MTNTLEGKTSENGKAIADSAFPMISQAISELIPALRKIPWWDLVKAIGNMIVTAFTSHPKEATMFLVAGLSFFFGGPIIAAAFMAIKAGAWSAMQKGAKSLMKIDWKKAAKGSSAKLGNVLKRILPKGAAVGMKGAGLALGKFASKVFPITALIAAGDAWNDINAKMGAELNKTYGKLGAEGGMAAAAAIDMITFGLLPDDWIGQIAEFTATILVAFHNLFDAIGLGWLTEGLGSLIHSVMEAFGGIAEVIIGIFQGDTDRIAKGFESMFEGLFTFAMTSASMVGRFLIEGLPELLRSFGTMVGGAALWLVTDGAKMLFNAIKRLGQGIMDTFIGLWDFLTDPSAWLSVFNNAFEAGMGVLEGMKNGWVGMADDFMESISELWTAFKDYWGISSPSTLMFDAAMEIVNGFMDAISGLPDGFMTQLDLVWTAVSGWVSEMSTSAYDSGVSILTGIKNGMLSVVDWFSGLGSTIWANVTSYFGGFGPYTEGYGIYAVGYNVILGIWNGIMAGVGWFANVGEQILDNIMSSLTGSPIEAPTAPSHGIGSAMMEGMIGGLESGLEGIQEVMTEMLARLAALMGAMGPRIGEIFVNGLMETTEVILEGMQDTAMAFLTTFEEMFMGLNDIVQNILIEVLQTFHIGFSGFADIITESGILEAFEHLGRSMVGVFSVAMGAIIDTIDSAVSGIVNAIRGAISIITDVLTLVSGLAGFGGISSIISGGLSLFGGRSASRIEGRLENFADTFNAVEATELALQSLESAISSRGANATEATAERIASIVDAYNDTARSLQRIRPINIDAVLEQVNDTLRVRRDQVTIEDQGVTINMSLNVTMKAEDVAIPMIEADLVTRGTADSVTSLGRTTSA